MFESDYDTKGVPVLDCRGMKCPMPIIQTRLKLNLMKKDDRLVVLADDDTFKDEFARFCVLADIKLLSCRYCGTAEDAFKPNMGAYQEYLIIYLK